MVIKAFKLPLVRAISSVCLPLILLPENIFQDLIKNFQSFLIIILLILNSNKNNYIEPKSFEKKTRFLRNTIF